VSTAPGSASARRLRSSYAVLKTLDCLGDPAGSKRDLAETGERRGARWITRLQAREEQALGLVDLAEAQSDLGVEELDGLDNRCIDPGREPLARHVEADRELVDHLEGGHARACLESRDVGGSATGERELPLGQTGPVAGRLQADPKFARRVDVSREGTRHAPSVCLRSRALTNASYFEHHNEQNARSPRGLSPSNPARGDSPHAQARITRCRCSPACHRTFRRRRRRLLALNREA